MADLLQTPPSMQVTAIPRLEQLKGMLAETHIWLAEISQIEDSAPRNFCLNLTIEEFICFVQSQNITALYYQYSYPAITQKAVTLPPHFQIMGASGEIPWGASFEPGRQKPKLSAKELLGAVELCNRKLGAVSGAAQPCKLVLYAPHPAGHFVVLRLTAPVTAAELQAPDFNAICRSLVVAKEESGYAFTVPQLSRLREVKQALFQAIAPEEEPENFLEAHTRHIQYVDALCSDPLSPENPLLDFPIWYSLYERSQLVKCLDAAWQIKKEGITEYTPMLDVRLPLSLYI